MMQHKEDDLRQYRVLGLTLLQLMGLLGMAGIVATGVLYFMGFSPY